MMDFDVIAATTVEEALDALGRYGDEAKVVAGGQSLLNILKQGLMAPAALVDVRGVSGLDALEADGALKIGATVLHRTLELSEDVRRTAPVLCEMERHLASVQIRNWGTLGGNLCMADPTGDPAPCLLALDASLVVQGPKGTRVVGVEDFFVDYYETVLEPDELLVRVDVPAGGPRTGAATEKFRNVEGDAPIVVAAVRLVLDDAGRLCRDVRIALGGASPVPLRAREAEKVLLGQEPTPEAVAEAAAKALEETSPIPDITASEAFKKKLVGVLVKRVTMKAAERARSGGL